MALKMQFMFDSFVILLARISSSSFNLILPKESPLWHNSLSLSGNQSFQKHVHIFCKKIEVYFIWNRKTGEVSIEYKGENGQVKKCIDWKKKKSYVMEDGIENPIHRLFLITHTKKKPTGSKRAWRAEKGSTGFMVIGKIIINFQFEIHNGKRKYGKCRQTVL
jgi:hypothetical protein